MRTQQGNLAIRAYAKPMPAPLTRRQAKRRHRNQMLREGLTAAAYLALFILMLCLAMNVK